MLLAAERVHGQFEPWAREFERPFRSSSHELPVDEIAAELELSPSQQSHLQSVLAAHLDDIEALKLKWKKDVKALERAVSDAPPHERLDARDDREQQLAAVADGQRAKERQFIADVEAVLTEEQLERFRRVMRHRRFDRYIGSYGVTREELLPLPRLLDEIVARAGADEARRADVLMLTATLRDQVGADLEALERACIDRARHHDRDHRAIQHFDASGGLVTTGLDSSVRSRRLIQQHHRVRASLQRQLHAFETALRDLDPELHLCWHGHRHLETLKYIDGLAKPAKQLQAHWRDSIDGDELPSDQQQLVRDRVLAFIATTEGDVNRYCDLVAKRYEIRAGPRSNLSGLDGIQVEREKIAERLREHVRRALDEIALVSVDGAP